MQIKSKKQVDEMSFIELKEYNKFLWSIKNEIWKKVDDLQRSIPMPKSLQDIGGGAYLSQQERNDFKASYLIKKQDRLDDIEHRSKVISDSIYSKYGATENDIEYGIGKYNEYIRKIPNSEKYKDDILLLQEAKKSAISAAHKDRIGYAIKRIETNGNDYRDDEFTKLWYLGAKQFVTGIIIKLGGTKYHKSNKDVTGSVYYNLPNTDSVRISDHQLPNTETRAAKRQAGIGGKWIEIVLDEPKPLSVLKEEVLQTLINGIGTGDMASVFKNETEELAMAINKIMAQKEFGGTLDTPVFKLNKSIICNYSPTIKGMKCTKKTLNSSGRCHHHIGQVFL